MKRRGFTLIELLVVVAIIALLIAILMPSLNRARMQARRVVCGSNMRAIALAVHTYANDYHGLLITAGLAHGGSVDEHAAWTNTLRDYYTDPAILRCPSDKSPYWEMPVPATDPPQKRRTSYASNYYTVKAIGGRGPYDRLSKIRTPASTIHMVELTAGLQPDQVPYAVADHVHPESWLLNPRHMAGQQIDLDRHLDRANYSFLDGHAQPLTFEETYSYMVDQGASGGPGIVWQHNKYDPAIAR
jgi:prepilin-type N-terminal cleavage/methylation domain-containing protein/prepilin-type processing-associated H-X9-DG protein